MLPHIFETFHQADRQQHPAPRWARPSGWRFVRAPGRAARRTRRGGQRRAESGRGISPWYLPLLAPPKARPAATGMPRREPAAARRTRRSPGWIDYGRWWSTITRNSRRLVKTVLADLRPPSVREADSVGRRASTFLGSTLHRRADQRHRNAGRRRLRPHRPRARARAPARRPHPRRRADRLRRRGKSRSARWPPGFTAQRHEAGLLPPRLVRIVARSRRSVRRCW